MAPHASASTPEQGKSPISSWSTLNQTSSPNGGSSTQSIDSENSNHPTGSLAPPHANGNTINLYEDEITTNGSLDGVDTPKSTDSSEKAYVHGYKDGYTLGFTKSHIELKHQPIAIIGMSCRLPGSVSTPDEFWELLARSRTGFSPVPASRFSANRFHHPNPGKSGTTNARGGNCTYTTSRCQIYALTKNP
jgi:hypothetical protein